MIYLYENNWKPDSEENSAENAFWLRAERFLEPLELKGRTDPPRAAAWLLLEYGLRREYGMTAAQLEIQREMHGKPVSGAYPELFFNISHCREASACVISRYPCGIDVERRFPYRGNLARKVCHPREQEIFAGLREEERASALCLLWSLKESFVKWNGRGLAYGLDRVDFSAILLQYIDIGSSRSSGRSDLQMRDGEKGQTLQLIWQTKERYTMACCAELQAGPVMQLRDAQLAELVYAQTL